MGILQLTSKKADAVEVIERELASLNDQGVALVADIERLAARETEMEESDDVLKAMGATLAARNRLRRLDDKIAETQARLDAAKASANAKLRAALLADYARAAADYLEKARAVLDAVGPLIAARQAVSAAGFRSDYDSLPLPPLIGASTLLSPDLLSKFEVALNPARRLSAAKPARLDDKSLALPAPKPKTGARPAAEHKPAARPRNRPPLRETPGEGEELYFVCRDGLELPVKGRLLTRDAIALTPDKAKPLVRSNVITPISAEELAVMDAHEALYHPVPKEAAE